MRAGTEDARPALATRELGGTEYWLPADQADAAPPRAGRRRGYLLPAYDEFLLGYKDRAAQLSAEHSRSVVPGGNGVFTPLIVVGGRVVGTWARGRGERLDDRAPAVRARRARARRARAGRCRALPALPRNAAAGRHRLAHAHRDRPLHARPARPRPARARRRRRLPPIASCPCSSSTAPCSRASARPIASPSCSTRSPIWMRRCARAAARSSCARATSSSRRCASPRSRARRRSSSSEDVSAYAQARERALRAACEAARLAAERPAGRHGDPARRPRPGRRRLLPRLHAVLAALAPRAAARGRRGAAEAGVAGKARSRPAAGARRTSREARSRRSSRAEASRRAGAG